MIAILQEQWPYAAMRQLFTGGFNTANSEFCMIAIEFKDQYIVAVNLKTQLFKLKETYKEMFRYKTLTDLKALYKRVSFMFMCFLAI